MRENAMQGERTQRKRKCYVCGKSLNAYEGNPVTTYIGASYVCQECYDGCTEAEAFNDEVSGTRQAEVATRIMLEAVRIDKVFYEWMITNNFKKIKDMNPVKLVGPNWNGLQSTTKILKRIEDAIDNGQLILEKPITIYISFPQFYESDLFDKGVKCFYWELFDNVRKIFQQKLTDEEQRKILGCPIPNEKYIIRNGRMENGWITLDRGKYIVINICRFVNEKQFLDAMKLFRTIGDSIEKWLEEIAMEQGSALNEDEASKIGMRIAKKIDKEVEKILAE